MAQSLSNDKNIVLIKIMQVNIKSFLDENLNTSFVGRQIYYYSSLPSTMEKARELAREGVEEGTTIITETQTSGRGRLGRIWLSPKGNLAISIILKPAINNLPKLVMIGSLAVVRAIKNVTGIDAQIKWPNDVLIRSKKICGILIENEVKGNKVNFAILGIGMNVNLKPELFPDISDIATSLLYEMGREVSRNDFSYVLLSELENLYLKFGDGNSIFDEWKEKIETLGKQVQVKIGDTIKYGKAESVRDNGNLILRHYDGGFSEISSGDIIAPDD